MTKLYGLASPSGRLFFAGVAWLCILLAVLFHRNGIDAGEPAMQVDVRAAGGAERLILFDRGLAAERTWLAGGEVRSVHAFSDKCGLGIFQSDAAIDHKLDAGD